MDSSPESFWKLVEGWYSAKSQMKLYLKDRLNPGVSLTVTIEGFERDTFIEFRNAETLEIGRLELDKAVIRPSRSPLPVERATGLKELEYGHVFNIFWTDEPGSEASLWKIRDFGKPV
jgi:hypothetical protein